MENIRDLEIKKLKYFINNPGYFSILVLGDNGTGKENSLRKILEEIEKQKENILMYYQPFEIGNSENEISEIFTKDFIIIKNLEELSDYQQNILTKALSTNDGKIGIDKNRGFKRIIFTSSFHISELRSNPQVSHRFLDRISQLVIKLPSFKDISINIKDDFCSVWEKMNFNEYPKKPEDGEFFFWLKENCGNFAGNFRDLDKIAILWHQYRIIEYEGKEQKFKSDVEARIFRNVRSDFEKFTHFPTQKSDNTNTFEFEKGKTWEQIERNFKAKFKIWAKNEYGTIKNATEELNMPFRKMDKW